MAKSGETAKLEAPPSEYFRRQCFISVDPDEDQVEWVVQKLGDETLVFSTDYPHSDSHFPEATNLFLKLPLSEAKFKKDAGMLPGVRLWGEPRYSLLERQWTRPALTVIALEAHLDGFALIP